MKKPLLFVDYMQTQIFGMIFLVTKKITMRNRGKRLNKKEMK